MPSIGAIWQSQSTRSMCWLPIASSASWPSPVCTMVLQPAARRVFRAAERMVGSSSSSRIETSDRPVARAALTWRPRWPGDGAGVRAAGGTGARAGGAPVPRPADRPANSPVAGRRPARDTR